LDCSNATFQGPANFELLACGGDGLFNNTQFEIKKNAAAADVVDYGDVAFNLSSFASTLDLSFATFARTVSLEQVNVQKALRLTRTRFDKDASLYNATIGRLILKGGSPFFADKAYLDLRECTFERFQGTPVQAMQFAREQNPTTFSRDPYLQLEKHYESIGQDIQAREVHYQGRNEMRKSAKRASSNGNLSPWDRYLLWFARTYMKLFGAQQYAFRVQNDVEWSFSRKVSDEILRLLTGYGVKIGRLFVIALIFLILGTLVFYVPDNALRAASGSTEPPPWQKGPLYRAAYSLDLFLPVVNLHIDENWEPNGPWLQAYAIGHATVGWLIVPLLLAALAGIIRR
jgi:hypothetical protein